MANDEKVPVVSAEIVKVVAFLVVRVDDSEWFYSCEA